MRSENQFTNSSEPPVNSAVSKTVEVVDPKAQAFEAWLECGLQALEIRYADFITNKSKLASLGR